MPTEQRGRQDPEAGRGPRRRGGERTDPDRALRALISTRSTQLPPDIALRAREYAAPSPQELAEADRELVIVRRNYVPPTPFAAGRRSGGKRG